MAYLSKLSVKLTIDANEPFPDAKITLPNDPDENNTHPTWKDAKAKIDVWE